MTNKEVAKLLSEIGELLELKGESVFRVRAYQRAATAVDQLPTEIEQFSREGRLAEIPGVGEGIAQRITEYLTTGHCEYYENLRAQFPPEFQEILGVPGIGARRAMRLLKELGVLSVADLEQAALQGRIRELPGMGVKIEQSILQAIQRIRERSKRIPLEAAVHVVERTIEWVRKNASAHNIVAVGSYRRMVPTVGDIDIICTSSDPNSVMDTFATMPDVREILAKGSTKTTVVVPDGIQVDLRVVPHEAFGSLLQHFTGSKGHNIQLREYAQTKGLSVSEYGIKETASGVQTPYATEEGVYARLGMDWVPPELREGLGEIELALTHQLPKLVAQESIRGDLHVHSNYSDGASTIEEIAREAEKIGYEYIAISDHSVGRGIASGLSLERLEMKREQMRKAQQNTRVHLLMGSEVDIRADGSLDYSDDVLAGLDVVVAGVHSSMGQDRQTMTRRIIRAMQNPYVHAISHPTGRILGSRDAYEVDVEAMLRAAAETGTAMEIDGVPGRLDLDGIHARRAKELGVKLVVNTDSHNAATLHRFMWFGIGQARRGWLEPRHVLNTLPLEEMLKLLHQKKILSEA